MTKTCDKKKFTNPKWQKMHNTTFYESFCLFRKINARINDEAT